MLAVLTRLVGAGAGAGASGGGSGGCRYNSWWRVADTSPPGVVAGMGMGMGMSKGGAEGRAHRGQWTPFERLPWVCGLDGLDELDELDDFDLGSRQEGS